MQRPITHKDESEDKVRRKLSLSSSKLANSLSLSFYDESTLRKNKQIILDNCEL